jgi:anti-anti-sigma factor
MNTTETSPVSSIDSPELRIQISFRTSGTPTALLTLTGNVLRPNLKLLHSAFNECLANGKNTVIVDMEKVDIVSSVGWKRLVSEKNRLQSKGVTLLLCGLRPEVYTAFTNLQLKETLKTFPTIAACQKEIELEGEYQKNEPLKEISQTLPISHNIPRSIEISSIEINSEKDNLEPNSIQSILEKNNDQYNPSVHEKISAIISLNGPCSLLQIYSHLHSNKYKHEKIGLLKLIKILREMNCETRNKRERFFRSC